MAEDPQNISDMSFEEALRALQQVVRQLEDGEVPLDQSIALYERGEKLRAACQARLDAAQARHQVTWQWVKGHAGHPENERADELVRLGADETAGG